MPHAVYIPFVFALGACIGSFLNVVVWRLPRGESLSSPPSHCPKCNTKLKWYDNLPIVGWLKLGGRCRYCREPISARYPIVEAATALLFVLYYVMYYVADVGPCPPVATVLFPGATGVARYHPPEAPVFLLHLFLLSALLAASLIDADLFIIPLPIPWTVAAVAVVAHAVFDDPRAAGAVNAVRADGSASPTAALAVGGAAGLLASLLLSRRGVLGRSFPDGEPLLEVEREAAEREAAEAKNAPLKPGDPPRAGDPSPAPLPPAYTRAQIRREMRKEMAFLLPPLGLAILWWVLTSRVPGLSGLWAAATGHDWVTGLLGSVFGGLVGGLVVWVVRILGTLGFGRVAMGLGDADLMLGVGAALGAGPVTVAFFIAPFFGILTALYLLATGSRRELPYGPYLSMAAAAVMLCYCPIEAWLAPGLAGLGMMLRGGG